MLRTVCVAVLVWAVLTSSTAAQDRGFAIQPGFGLGFSAGVVGSSDEALQNSMGYEGYFRYGWSFGLFLNGGVQTSTNGFNETSQRYHTTTFFVEPRYTALNLSSKVAPFVSTRLGYTKENVSTPRAEFAGSGMTLGGGGGLTFQLTTQVALEGSLTILTTSYSDFAFRGDRDWYLCLESLESGTTLPEAVTGCSDAPGNGPVYNCYPPFYEELAGDCAPPTITYEGSKRSSTWFQAKLGLQISITTP